MSKFLQIIESCRGSADILLIYDTNVDAYDELFGLKSADSDFFEVVLNLQKIALEDLKQYTERMDITRILLEKSKDYLYIFYSDDLIETFTRNTLDSNTRYCSYCGKGFKEGYCVLDGDFYYCSDECLDIGFGIEDFKDLYEDGGDSYYTTWYFGDEKYW